MEGKVDRYITSTLRKILKTAFSIIETVAPPLIIVNFYSLS